MKRAKSIGGVFMQADDPEELYHWYEKHLGIQREPRGQGAMMHWGDVENRKRCDRLGLVEKGTKYFGEPRARPC